MSSKKRSLFLVVLVSLVTLFSIAPAHADIEGGHSIGPLYAFGNGDLQTAQAEAYDNMLDTIDALALQLGPGETITGYAIMFESYDFATGVYEIEFMVYVSQGPPGA